MRHLIGVVVPVMLGLSLSVGRADEPRRDTPWGDWIDADVDYDGACGRSIGPDESRVWPYSGELSEGVGPGFHCYNSRTPMCLDYKTDDGKVCPGIFRYEGSLLVRCYSINRVPFDPRGQYDSRPTDFVANAENGFHIEILRPAMDGETQLGGSPTSRQHPDTDKPPFPEISKEWRVIRHTEKGETTVPNDQAVWMVRRPRETNSDYHPGEINAFLRGPMIFTMNPVWLDEVRHVGDGTQGSGYEVRPGLCRRAGDCLLWIVAPQWESPRSTNSANKDRPSSFQATKENGYILRVLYPADQMK